MRFLDVALDRPATVIVAVGLLEKRVSLAVARPGIAALEKPLAVHALAPVIAIEATGSCTGRGRRSWSGCIRAPFGYSHHRKPRPRGCSWARAGSRPMTVTAQR